MDLAARTEPYLKLDRNKELISFQLRILLLVGDSHLPLESGPHFFTVN